MADGVFFVEVGDGCKREPNGSLHCSCCPLQGPLFSIGAVTISDSDVAAENTAMHGNVAVDSIY